MGEYFLIAIVAFLASGLTFFSGFGLGSLLLPFFVLFFPIPVAVAATAIVHLLNNLFKLFLIGKYMDRAVVLRFGVPALLAAFVGAWLLNELYELPIWFSYEFAGETLEIKPVNLVIALLILFFLGLEVFSWWKQKGIGKKYLPLGGVISGFLGGLSGHQGAARSAFLLTCNLSKEAFVASNVVIACMVDVARLLIYSYHFDVSAVSQSGSFIITAVLSAFGGAWIGRQLLKKVTMRWIQLLISILLLLLALAIGFGLI